MFSLVASRYMRFNFSKAGRTDFLDELEPVRQDLVGNGEDVRRLLRRLRWWGDHG